MNESHKEVIFYVNHKEELDQNIKAIKRLPH